MRDIDDPDLDIHGHVRRFPRSVSVAVGLAFVLLFCVAAGKAEGLLSVLLLAVVFGLLLITPVVWLHARLRTLRPAPAASEPLSVLDAQEEM